MKSNLVVSVGIPAYNARKTIERALDSALSQTIREPYEIIVMDDGSTDTTWNTIRAYGLRFPDIIRVYSFPNRGVAIARNSIVKRCRRKYITWLDADDIYFPTKLESQLHNIRDIEKVAKERMALVFSPFRMGDVKVDYGAYLDAPLKHILSGDLRAYLWASMTRRETYQKVGPFDGRLHRSEDQDWLIRFVQAGGLIAAAPGPAEMQYTFSTARDGKRVEESLGIILSRYKDLFDLYELTKEFVPRRYWEISGFYQSNRAWDDMWRCRALAVQGNMEAYLPKLVGAIITEVRSRDNDMKREIQEEMRRMLDEAGLRLP